MLDIYWVDFLFSLLLLAQCLLLDLGSPLIFSVFFALAYFYFASHCFDHFGESRA